MDPAACPRRSPPADPAHYLSDRAGSRLPASVCDDLREEVLAEALTRNLPAYQRFFEAVALPNGQIVTSTPISREIGVAANTVRGYFDTRVATWVPAWTKRSVIQAPRFWFFDVGIVNELTRRGKLFPNEASLLRLASAVLSEISDDSDTERAYLNMETR